MNQVLAISGQYAAIRAAVFYFALRIIATGPSYTTPAPLLMMWLCVLIADAPPSAIHAGLVATLALDGA